MRPAMRSAMTPMRAMRPPRAVRRPWLLAMPLAALATLTAWGGAARGAGEERRESAGEPGGRAAALAAFDTVQAVLQHPRCQNCHIPGDSPLQFDAGVAHAQNVQRGPDGKGAPGLPCATCHAESNPHVSHDKLVLWGWAPGAGRAPVSIPHDAFVASVKTWIGGGAPCPEASGRRETGWRK